MSNTENIDVLGAHFCCWFSRFDSAKARMRNRIHVIGVKAKLVRLCKGSRLLVPDLTDLGYLHTLENIGTKMRK